MDELEISLQQGNVIKGETSRLALRVENRFDEALHNLSIRVIVKHPLQLLGDSRFTLDSIQPGECVLIDLFTRGLQAGPAEIRLERINALFGGMTIDFPDTSFQLNVIHPQKYPGIAPRLDCEPVDLTQSSWAAMRFRLENNSAFLLEGIRLIFSCNHMLFNDLGSRTMYHLIERLDPYQSIPIDLRIQPLSAGQEKLDISLEASSSEQVVQRKFEFGFSINQDMRPKVTNIETGDIVVVRGQMSIGGDIPAEDIIQPAESTPIPILITCPNCGSRIDSDSLFCNDCQNQIRAANLETED
jgi:hypothetical protein